MKYSESVQSVCVNNVAEEAPARKRQTAAITNRPHYRLHAVSFWSSCKLSQVPLAIEFMTQAQICTHRNFKAYCRWPSHNSSDKDGFWKNPAGVIQQGSRILLWVLVVYTKKCLPAKLHWPYTVITWCAVRHLWVHMFTVHSMWV